MKGGAMFKTRQENALQRRIKDYLKWKAEGRTEKMAIAVADIEALNLKGISNEESKALLLKARVENLKKQKKEKEEKKEESPS